PALAVILCMISPGETRKLLTRFFRSWRLRGEYASQNLALPGTSWFFHFAPCPRARPPSERRRFFQQSATERAPVGRHSAQGRLVECQRLGDPSPGRRESSRQRI